MAARMSCSGAAPGAVSRSNKACFAGGDVLFRIVPRISRSKVCIVLDYRCPRPAARIGAKRFTLCAHQRHHLVEPALAHEGDMIGKAPMTRHAIFGAADGPVQNHARHHFRMGDGKTRYRRAAHAAADEMRARDLQVIKQAFALRHVMRPRDRLDAAAGLAAFPPIEQDAGEMRGQMDHASTTALKPPGAYINSGGPEPTTSYRVTMSLITAVGMLPALPALIKHDAEK